MLRHLWHWMPRAGTSSLFFQDIAMNFFLRRALILFLTLTGLAGAVHAQRASVPIMDFRDIPVSLSSSKALSAEQVRQAFLVAAVAERWDVATLPNGNLQLTTLKNGKHTVVIDVIVGADKYSVLYSNSEKLNYVKSVIERSSSFGTGQVSMAETARVQQLARFSNLPESKFAAPKDVAVIHPSYEAWVHELLGGVRRQLALL